MKPLIALDRDGTLIREGHYMSHPRQVKLLVGAAQGLKRLRKAGYKVIVLSNQSGVGRGAITAAEALQVRDKFLSDLRRAGAHIDGYYWCPHAPERNCACRKPKLKLLKEAARKMRMPWRGAWSVGDRPSDVQIGQKAGGKGILVRTGYGQRWAKKRNLKAAFVARNFNSAVSWILKQEKGPQHDR